MGSVKSISSRFRTLDNATYANDENGIDEGLNTTFEQRMPKAFTEEKLSRSPNEGRKKTL